MMNQVYTTLPDDRPITAICVVENAEKCPKGFVVVSKTYDQDSDADLWRETGFFGRKCTRYLCLSKTEGSADRVVETVAVIAEKDNPPEGYSVISKTFDTGQKAWRKKRLCYKAAHAGSCTSAVTDIIVLSRMKKPPEEFVHSGDVNGMTLCHKIGRSSQPTLIIPPYSIQPLYPAVPPSLGPDYVNAPAPAPAPVSPSQDYVVLRRPPPPPPIKYTSTYATISGFSGLEGIPFILNPSFSFAEHESPRVQSLLKPKTSSQIDEEFSYNFRTERET